MQVGVTGPRPEFSFGVPSGPTAIGPRLSPVGGCRLYLPGSYTWAAALFLMLLLAIGETATVYLIYELGRWIADDRAAGLMATLWACSLPSYGCQPSF